MGQGELVPKGDDIGGSSGCTEIGSWGGEQRGFWNPLLLVFSEGHHQPYRGSGGALETEDQCYFKLCHVSMYGAPPECLAWCWALWIQEGLGELTVWVCATHRSTDGQHNTAQGVDRASELHRSGCQGLLLGVLFRPVLGCSAGSDGKYTRGSSDTCLHGLEIHSNSDQWSLGKAEGRAVEGPDPGVHRGLSSGSAS